MPTNTPNVSLAKPLVNEKYDVDILNENFDKLDLAMAGAIEFPVVTAGAVTVTPTGNLSSTNVQNALAELDTEKADKLFATNLVTNGDFSNGTTGWVLSSCTATTANNIATITATAVSESVGIYSPAILTNNTKNNISFWIRSGFNSNLIINGVSYNFGLIPNEWKRISILYDKNEVNTGRISIYKLPNAIGDTFDLQFISAIDLTTDFGETKEPKLYTFDKLLLSNYPYGFFNGKNVVVNSSNLFNEKVNKEDVNIITEDYKKYKIVSGVIRHNGTSWSIINDSEHTPINIASVTNDTNEITVNYNFTATKVVSLVACQDETFNLEGYLFGGSVGVSLSKINIFRTPKTIGGYIIWNGSAWNFTNAKGITGVSFSSGILTITHEYMDDYICNANTRDGVYIPAVGSLGTTTSQVKFFDYAGNLITTPNTDMKLYFERSRTSGKANPQTTNIAGANILIYGIFEVN